MTDADVYDALMDAAQERQQEAEDEEMARWEDLQTWLDLCCGEAGDE